MIGHDLLDRDGAGKEGMMLPFENGTPENGSQGKEGTRQTEGPWSGARKREGPKGLVQQDVYNEQRVQSFSSVRNGNGKDPAWRGEQSLG